MGGGQSALSRVRSGSAGLGRVDRARVISLNPAAEPTAESACQNRCFGFKFGEGIGPGSSGLSFRTTARIVFPRLTNFVWRLVPDPVPFLSGRRKEAF